MKKADIIYIVGSVFAAMTALFYCGTTWFSLKLPCYYPLEHTWKWGKEEGIPSQGWYSKQALAYLAAAVVALTVYLLLKYTRLKNAGLNPALTKLLGVVVIIVVVLCMGYMLYHEFVKWRVF
ncbi:MAG TPA: hypothetical protein EYP85_06835 [Armatimonadetes bacterium]|nr:hypothetical protein [Armatimonadota bacterium]